MLNLGAPPNQRLKPTELAVGVIEGGTGFDKNVNNGPALNRRFDSAN